MENTYDKDIVAWAQEQARLLRSGQLSKIDIEHIAEFQPECADYRLIFCGENTVREKYENNRKNRHCDFHGSTLILF